MVAIYLVGPTIDVEVVNTHAIDLGFDESLTKDLGSRCAF
jgi:hypothetical protein